MTARRHSFTGTLRQKRRVRSVALFRECSRVFLLSEKNQITFFLKRSFHLNFFLTSSRVFFPSGVGVGALAGNSRLRLAARSVSARLVTLPSGHPMTSRRSGSDVRRQTFGDWGVRDGSEGVVTIIFFFLSCILKLISSWHLFLHGSTPSRHLLPPAPLESPEIPRTMAEDAEALGIKNPCYWRAGGARVRGNHLRCRLLRLGVPAEGDLLFHSLCF